MKILVTGGAGFIGSNLCDALLERNYEVHCMDNLLTGNFSNISHLMGNPKFTFFETDIRSIDSCQEAMNGCDFVAHLAALGSVPRSINDPLTTNSINIDGFLNVIHSAKELSIKRFVFAASSSTYGDSASLPKQEDIIGNPLSPYAVGKYVNELYAHVYALNYGLNKSSNEIIFRMDSDDISNPSRFEKQLKVFQENKNNLAQMLKIKSVLNQIKKVIY